MKSICIVLLLAISCSVFAQQKSTSKETYLKKSKQQKTIAWSLLGGGIVMNAIGTIVSLKEAVKIPFAIIQGEPQADEGKLTAGAVLIITGSAAIVSSIPLFIVSHKNKKRAASVSFKNEQFQTLQKSSFIHKYQPSINLTLSF